MLEPTRTYRAVDQRVRAKLFRHTHLVRGACLMLKPREFPPDFFGSQAGCNTTNPPLTRWVCAAI